LKQSQYYFSPVKHGAKLGFLRGVSSEILFSFNARLSIA